MKPLMVIISLAAAAGICGGCTTVKPWQWGHLSKQEMAGQPDVANAALAERIHCNIEGSYGGAAARVGGCGNY